MLQIVGLVIVLLLVGGGLVVTGGPATMEALPFELALIGGAAFGTVLIGNSPDVAREAFAGFGRAFKGARWTTADYADLLGLLGTLMRKAKRGGFVAIEADIERPEESPVFQAAPRILEDAASRTLICDAFRLMALDLADPARADQRMGAAIDAQLDRRLKAVGALNTLADALPALGIVAAVLGIIRTMGAIDQDPAVLGALRSVDFAEVCITSALSLTADPEPAEAFRLPEVPGVGVVFETAPGEKCQRCWKILPEVNTRHHPHTCARCNDALG